MPGETTLTADGSYGPGRTRAGIPCPWPAHADQDALTEHQAVLPMVDTSDPVNPKIIHPHEYAVCHACHAAQYQTRYGRMPV